MKIKNIKAAIAAALAALTLAGCGASEAGTYYLTGFSGGGYSMSVTEEELEISSSSDGVTMTFSDDGSCVIEYQFLGTHSTTLDPEEGKSYLSGTLEEYSSSVDAEIELKKDGTIILGFADEEFEGEWKIEDDILTVTSDDGTVTELEYEDGVITFLDPSGSYMIFEKDNDVIKSWKELAED